jgi:glycosyltransferase involved in cell wall biosynthesis
LGADNRLYKILFQSKIELKKTFNIDNAFTLLTVGSITPRKNHLGVLESVAILKSKGIYINYIIVGTGPSEKLTNELNEFVRKKDLSNQVKLLGYMPTEKLPEIYSACDLFVLNSKIDEQGDVEGFGIVIIEANLMGIPAIGTKNSGIEEAIEDGKSGLLVPMDSPEKLAEVIEYLYNDRDTLAKMGIYARARAVENYTWINTAQKTSDVIKSIVE